MRKENEATKRIKNDKMSFLIQIYGARKVVFEACHKILEFSDSSITIEGKKIVKIAGEKLRLLELGGANLGVEGNLSSIVFLNKYQKEQKGGDTP